MMGRSHSHIEHHNHVYRYNSSRKHLWIIWCNNKHDISHKSQWDFVKYKCNTNHYKAMLTLKIGFSQKMITTVGDNSLYRTTMVLSPPINGIYAKPERLGHEWTIISIIFTGDGEVIIFLPSVFVHACVCVCLSRCLSVRITLKDWCYTNNILKEYRWGCLAVQVVC